MGNRTLFLRVGGLLVGTIVILVVLILTLTGDRLGNGKLYETYFYESVQGLDVGAPVKYRGVTLGRVVHIGLVSAEYGAGTEREIMDPTYRLIIVRFKIDPKRVGRLPETKQAVGSGLRTKLANQGLTGVMYMEMDFLPPDQHPPLAVPWTPTNDYIPSVPSTLSQVQEAAQKVLNQVAKIDFAAISTHIDGLIGDLRHELSAGGDVGETLATARTTIAAVRTQIEKADLPALTAQLRNTGAAIQTLADGKRMKALLDQANTALARVPPLIASLQTTASRANETVGDVSADLAPILRDAQATMQNLRETTEALRRDPGQLLWQAPPPRKKP